MHIHAAPQTRGKHELTQSFPLQSAPDAGLNDEPADSGVILASCVMSANCTKLSKCMHQHINEMTASNTSIRLLWTDDLFQ